MRVTDSNKLYGGDVRKTIVYYDKLISKKLKNDKLVQGLSQVINESTSNNSDFVVEKYSFPRQM